MESALALLSCMLCDVCLLDRCAVDRQLLTKSRHHRVCYEAANPTPTVTNATRLLFLRCTDIYYITDNVNLSLRTSEFQQSVAQLCCSVLNPSLAQFNVQPAASLEVRISLHQSVVSITDSLMTFLCTIFTHDST